MELCHLLMNIYFFSVGILPKEMKVPRITPTTQGDNIILTYQTSIWEGSSLSFPSSSASCFTCPCRVQARGRGRRHLALPLSSRSSSLRCKTNQFCHPGSRNRAAIPTSSSPLRPSSSSTPSSCSKAFQLSSSALAMRLNQLITCRKVCAPVPRTPNLGSLGQWGRAQ